MAATVATHMVSPHCNSKNTSKYSGITTIQNNTSCVQLARYKTLFHSVIKSTAPHRNLKLVFHSTLTRHKHNARNSFSCYLHIRL